MLVKKKLLLRLACLKTRLLATSKYTSPPVVCLGLSADAELLANLHVELSTLNTNFKFPQLSKFKIVSCAAHLNVDWVSIVGIATRYGLDSPGIGSRRWRDFLLPSRPSLCPTQTPIQ
jgi:hypothetical protein